jgi:hypothetical protein
MIIRMKRRILKEKEVIFHYLSTPSLSRVQSLGNRIVNECEVVGERRIVEGNHHSRRKPTPP